MAPFRKLPQHQLSLLSNEALVDYITVAREAGEAEAEREAVAVLAFGLEATIRIWVGRTVPSQDVDDVVMDVLASMINASFDGKVLGEFGAFLKRVAQRRVADHYRRQERRLPTETLASDHEGDDDVWGQVPSSPDETPMVDLSDAVGRVLATRNALHQKVIRLYGSDVDGFEDLSATAVKARIEGDGSGDTIGLDNIAKIWSRFTSDLREQLDG